MGDRRQDNAVGGPGGLEHLCRKRGPVPLEGCETDLMGFEREAEGESAVENLQNLDGCDRGLRSDAGAGQYHEMHGVTRSCLCVDRCRRIACEIVFEKRKNQYS